MSRVSAVFAYPYREPVNGVTHLIGALASLVGFVWLMTLPHKDVGVTVALVIYGLSMTVLYATSAVYHLTDGSPGTLLWLQRLDHSAIYLLIAACYTPVCMTVIQGEWRWILMGIVWAMAVGGVAYKMLFLVDPGLFSLIYYMIMACAALIAPPGVLAMIPAEATALILLSAIPFVGGAIIFGTEKPNLHRLLGYHELWHILVMTGSVMHFVAVLYCLRQ